MAASTFDNNLLFSFLFPTFHECVEWTCETFLLRQTTRLKLISLWLSHAVDIFLKKHAESVYVFDMPWFIL